MLQEHSTIGIAHHGQIDVDSSLAFWQVFSSIDTFRA
jgi:hypothetical protein